MQNCSREDPGSRLRLDCWFRWRHPSLQRWKSQQAAQEQADSADHGSFSKLLQHKRGNLLQYVSCEPFQKWSTRVNSLTSLPNAVQVECHDLSIGTMFMTFVYLVQHGTADLSHPEPRVIPVVKTPTWEQKEKLSCSPPCSWCLLCDLCLIANPNQLSVSTRLVLQDI